MRLILLAIILPTIACIFPNGRLVAQSPGPAKGIELAPGGCTVLFELHSDKIYVKVKVNDSGPWPLVLDTGSSHSLLDLDVARELKLAVTGISKGVHGAGEMSV